MLLRGKIIVNYIPGIGNREYTGQADDPLYAQVDTKRGVLIGDNMWGRILMTIIDKYYPWYLEQLELPEHNDEDEDAKDKALRKAKKEAKEVARAFQQKHCGFEAGKKVSQKEREKYVAKSLAYSAKLYTNFMDKYAKKKSTGKREKMLLQIATLHLPEEKVQDLWEEFKSNEDMSSGDKLAAIDALWEEEVQDAHERFRIKQHKKQREKRERQEALDDKQEDDDEGSRKKRKKTSKELSVEEKKIMELQKQLEMLRNQFLKK
jgi:hypothetical protein